MRLDAARAAMRLANLRYYEGGGFDVSLETE